ncbi:hypothetical protein ACTHGU_19780 [Chitinophagaceae bacterium MMS25-I14]
MKHIWKVAAIGLVAAVAFFVISLLVRIVVSVLVVGIVARLIFSLGRYSRFGMHSGDRFNRREKYGMQHAGAVSIDGDDWYRSGMKQSSREQKITVF